ncbi:hypothetical protein ACQ4PT_050524 [Festuca glaucescens]
MLARVKGTMKWFNMTRGFGFITPDDGSEDLFFRQFVINSDGSIIQNGAIEFTVGTSNDGRTRAYDLTTVGGGPLSSGPRPNDDRGVRKWGYDGGGRKMSERVKGTRKWFNMTRGFGFITPDDGSEDLFFRQFVIKSDGSIMQKGTVEFIVGTSNDGRTRAYDVTTPGGGALYVGSRPVDDRRVHNGYGGGGGKGGGCGPCGGRVFYKCGEEGHISRAPTAAGGAGGGRGSYKCGQKGHILRDCPQGTGNDGCTRAYDVTTIGGGPLFGGSCPNDDRGVRSEGGYDGGGRKMSERVNMTRGFGFITPDNGSEDLFFRQFVIKSDGSIIQNGAVEFIVGTGNDGCTRAYDVTTP